MVTIFLLEVIAITAKSMKQNTFVPQLLLGKDQYWVNAAGKSSLKQGAKLCIERAVIISFCKLCRKTCTWQKGGEDGHRQRCEITGVRGYGMSTTKLYKSLSSRFISNCGYRTVLHLHNSENLVPVNSNCCGTATEILGTGNLEGYKSMSNFMLLFDRKQWLTILRFWLFCSH